MDATELHEILDKAAFEEVRGMLMAYKALGANIQNITSHNGLDEWVSYYYQGIVWYVDRNKR